MCSNPIFLELVVLESCLHYKTIKEQPMDTFCFNFFGWGWEGGQDTPMYTHLKSKKGYFSEESICWENTANEVVSH